MIGKGREDARQQARLNIGRDLELALDRSFAAVVSVRFLMYSFSDACMALKVVVRNADFIIRTHCWQCHVKVSGATSSVAAVSNCSGLMMPWQWR